MSSTNKKIDEIWYRMSVFGAETDKDQEDVVLIAETLLKLPEDVRERVLDEATFIVADNVAGTVFSMYVEGHIRAKLLSIGIITSKNFDPLIKLSTIAKIALRLRFILLNFAEMKKMSKFNQMSVIAHEIAHFIQDGDSYNTREIDAEKEADDLVEKWSFKRSYKKTPAPLFRQYK
jgi:hypothetical protein